MTHTLLFFRIALVLVVLVPIVGCVTTAASAQSDDMLVLMVRFDKGQEVLDQYEILLEGITNSTQETLTLSFDRAKSGHDRLAIHEGYDISFDALDSNVYYISSESVRLCTVRYAGSDEILFNEYSRLEISSLDYYLRLVQVHYSEQESEFNPTDSAGVVIIVTLCSLIPFILEVPSAMEDLQDVLEAELSSFGTYGRLLRLFIPLIAVSLTFLLLETLRW